jgi:short-subunit dehydrogenase
MRRALTGDEAIVTGASSGIGRAIALGLAAEGARLGLVSRCASRLAAVIEEWPSQAPPPIAFTADLMDEDSVLRLSDAIGHQLGQVGILVHSAGGITLGPFRDLPAASLDEQYRLNVRAPFLLTQRLLPSIVRSRGQIVFVNSSAGLVARAGVSQYAASKHALKALADSLREEVQADGVRVISVFPGRTATPMQEKVRRMEGRPYSPEECLAPGDVADVVIQALTMPKGAEVREINIAPAAR